MSYDPLTDFLALLRQGPSGVALARVPGLDFVLAAMARAGIIQLSAGQTAPTSNQASTVWLRTSSPSWTAEGVVFLYNSSIGAYAAATPALWSALLASISGDVFQAVIGATATVGGGTTLLAVQRVAPATTALLLPAVNGRVGGLLRVVDWSTSVVQHVMTFTTPDGATIMRQNSFSVYSTPDQRGVANFYPSADLNGWLVT